MRLKLHCAVAFLLASLGCAPSVPSTDRHVQLTRVFSGYDVFAFGEYHGTNEAPRAFLSLIKDYLSTTNEQILVAVELPPIALKDARLAIETCDVVSNCAARISSSTYWKIAKDGRTSRAYFLLIQALVKLERQEKVRLVSADYRETGFEKFGEIAEEHLYPLVESSKRKLFVLTGNAHAIQDHSPNSLSTALSNRGLNVLTVNLSGSGGEAWVCSQGSCGIKGMPAEPYCADKANDFVDRTKSSVTYCLGKLTSSPPLLE